MTSCYERGNKMGRPRMYPMKKCEVKDCESKHYAKGYCRKHYGTQWRRDNYTVKTSEKYAEEQVV
ncbi:hypothetical protein D3C77_562420 [compost metagenome]